MRLAIPFILASGLFLVLGSIGSTEAPELKRFQPIVDRMVKAIQGKDFPAVQQDFNAAMIEAFPLEKSRPFFQNLLEQHGKIRQLDPGRFLAPNQAIYPCVFERDVMDMKLVLDSQDKIAGLWIQPHVPPLPVLERNLVPMSLPFKGTWLVTWGGETRETNIHIDTPNQKFAMDFIGRGEGNRTHEGKSLTNEDFYAFGREIIAPADGTISVVIDGVPDNIPGSMNPFSALGNAVILKHGENEYSVLAHFKRGSILVKVGETVKQGRKLGLCGNSGNSSEPHLHFHLQNTDVIQEATGMRCLFEEVPLSLGETMESKKDYAPVKGDVVIAP